MLRRTFEFNYRRNEITARVWASSLEEAKEKLRHGEVIGVEVHFESTWPEYWTLEEDHDAESTDRDE